MKRAAGRLPAALLKSLQMIKVEETRKDKSRTEGRRLASRSGTTMMSEELFPVLSLSSNLVLYQFHEQDADAALLKRLVKRKHTHTQKYPCRTGWLVENLLYLYQQVTAGTHSCYTCCKFKTNSPGRVVCVL